MPPRNPETLTYTGQLKIATKRGGLSTSGVGIFEAGPLGVGTEFHHVVAGTGEFSEATGTLFFDVEADETGAQFSEPMRGQICTPCDHDDERDDDDDEENV